MSTGFIYFITDTDVSAHFIPSYAITGSPASANESGNAFTFTVTTTNISNGTVLYWDVVSLSNGVVAADFVENITQGTVTINNNTATFTLTTVPSSLVFGSGNATFDITLKTGSHSGTLVATTGTETIINNTPPTTDTYFYTTALLLKPGSTINSNTFIDSSTNAFTITPTGTPSQSNFSPYLNNWSNYFNGSSYLTSTSASNYGLAGNFTFEAWILPTVTQSGSPTIFEATSAGSFQVGYSGSTFGVASQGSAWLVTGSTLPTVGIWNHIAVVRSGTTLSIFINGTRTATGTASNSFASSTTSYTGAAAGSNYFTGYISNVRLVNGTAIYDPTQTTLIVPTTNLTTITGTQLLTCQSNRFIDNSINNSTITLTGTPSIQTSNPFGVNTPLGGSVYFNGTSDFLSTPASASLAMGASDFTWECWINPITTSTSNSTIFGYRSGTDSAPTLYITNSHIVFGGDITNMLNVSYVVPTNTWTHLAVVRNGTSLTLYVNGNNVAATSNSTNFNYFTNGPIIGKANGAATYYFNGHISNLRIISGSGAAIYTSNFTPSTSPLTAITNTVLLLNGTNIEFIDSSSYTNTIVPVGTPIQGTNTPFDNGWSVYFDGSSKLQTTNAMQAFGTGDFTIEGWIMQTATAVQPGILGNSTSLDNNAFGLFTLGSNNNSLYFEGAGNGPWVFVGSPVVTGQWTHIAICRSGTTLSMWQNGTRTATGTLSNNLSSSNVYSIGDQGPSGPSSNNKWTGFISNLRVVAGTSVYSVASSTITVPTSSLTSITNTKLLTCQSDRFIDNSTIANVLTITGTPTTEVFSPLNPPSAISNLGSVYFSSASSYLVTPVNNINSVFTTNAFTVEAWVFPTSAQTWSTIMSSQYAFSSGTGNWSFYFNAGGSASLQFNSGLGNQASPTAVIVPLDTWTHLAYTRTGTTGRFFMNGVQVGTNITNTLNYAGATGNLFIGRQSDGTGNLTGYISNARILNGTAAYTANFTPPTTPFTDTNQTGLLLNATHFGPYDITGNNNILVVGTPTISTSTTKYSQSIKFSGSTDRLVCYNDVLFNFVKGDFTVECWIYLTSAIPAATSHLVGTADPNVGANGWGVRLDQAGITLVGNGDSQFSVSTTWSTSQWIHLAIVRSGTNVYIFKNGTSLGTSNITGTTALRNTFNFLAGNPLQIGAHSSVPTMGLPGYIEDLRICKGIARYTTTFTPPANSFPSY